MNSIFLDALDQDIRTLKRINQLLEKIPEERRGHRNVVNPFVMRPSEDLGKLAGGFEPDLPSMFRGLGTHETSSPDWLSMVLFDPNYLTRLIELGENDAGKQIEDLIAFMKA